MGTLLTVGANSSTPRRHGSGQNNEYIPNTRGKLCSSLPQVLVMFPLFCPPPCLRGVLELAPSVSDVLEDMEVHKIMRTVLTLGANSSTPRRDGSGQNNENITNTRDKLEHSTKTFSNDLIIFSPLPYLREVLEFVPSVSNVLIILSTSMSSWSARVGP
jgi:hypothetical protein